MLWRVHSTMLPEGGWRLLWVTWGVADAGAGQVAGGGAAEAGACGAGPQSVPAAPDRGLHLHPPRRGDGT